MFNILFSILLLQAVNSRAIDYDIVSTPDLLKELQSEIYDGYRYDGQDDYRIVHSKMPIWYGPYDMGHLKYIWYKWDDWLNSEKFES